MLIPAFVGVASAAVGTATITAQSPNPVQLGAAVTLTVHVQNTDSTAHMFSVTAASGTGISLVAGSPTCNSILGNNAGDLTVQVLTSATTPVNTVAVSLTVVESNTNQNCNSNRSQRTVTGNVATASTPLAIVMYQASCPFYQYVPANEDPANIDATGGYAAFLNTSAQLVAAAPSDIDTAHGCAAVPGWRFNLHRGSANGTSMGQAITGAGGVTTVNLTTAADIAAARTGGGVWIDETVPAGYGFAAIRCYNDMLNGDNSENISGVPSNVTTVNCVAFNVAPAPALSIGKAANVTHFSAGDTIGYTYVLTNTGNVTLTGPFTVTDNKFGSTISCGNASTTIAIGGNRSCVASYNVKTADVTAGSVTNIASATGRYNGATVATTKNASVTVTLAQPALSIGKSANVTYFSAGDSITYTYVLTNSGNVTLTGQFTVTDNKFSPATFNCGAAGAVVPVGDNVTCTKTYPIVAADVTAGFVTNVASATGHFGATTVGTTKNATVTVPLARPALAIVKTATVDTFDHAGQTITFHIRLTNSGNVYLTDPSVVDDTASTLDCGTVPDLLAPAAYIDCTATMVVSQSDLDDGSLYNGADGSAKFDGTPVTISGGVTLDALQDPAINLAKVATEDTFSAAGDVLHYTYTITNAGNVTLAGPFSVTDDKTDVTCPSTESLAVGASITCHATFTVAQADLDSGAVTNKATAHAGTGDDAINSDEKQVTVQAEQSTGLGLLKVATESSFAKVGDVLHYTYTLTNDGNVTLAGPFSVTDDKTAVTCPSTESLAPGDSIKCTSSYTVTAADMTALKVTNKATGHAGSGEGTLDSAPQTVTVTGIKPVVSPSQSLLGATATPTATHSQSLLGATGAPNATPPATNGSTGNSGDGGTPLFALLICLGFGAFAILIVEKQRRTVRS